MRSHTNIRVFVLWSRRRPSPAESVRVSESARVCVNVTCECYVMDVFRAARAPCRTGAGQLWWSSSAHAPTHRVYLEVSGFNDTFVFVLCWLCNAVLPHTHTNIRALTYRPVG